MYYVYIWINDSVVAGVDEAGFYYQKSVSLSETYEMNLLVTHQIFMGEQEIKRLTRHVIMRYFDQ